MGGESLYYVLLGIYNYGSEVSYVYRTGNAKEAEWFGNDPR